MTEGGIFPATEWAANPGHSLSHPSVHRSVCSCSHLFRHYSISINWAPTLCQLGTGDIKRNGCVQWTYRFMGVWPQPDSWPQAPDWINSDLHGLCPLCVPKGRFGISRQLEHGMWTQRELVLTRALPPFAVWLWVSYLHVSTSFSASVKQGQVLLVS